MVVFVYDKRAVGNKCELNFGNCTFIKKHRTAEQTITKRLREMIEDDANEEDIVAFLNDKNVPEDDIVYHQLPEEIMNNKPKYFADHQNSNVRRH